MFRYIHTYITVYTAQNKMTTAKTERSNTKQSNTIFKEAKNIKITEEENFILTVYTN